MADRTCTTGGDHTLSLLEELESIGGQVMECVVPDCGVQVVQDTDGIRHLIADHDDEIAWADRVARVGDMATMAGELDR